MFFTKFLNTVQIVLEKFFNPCCLLCSKPAFRSKNICQNCEQNLPILPQVCTCCARFLTSAREHICAICLHNAPHFERIFPLFPYEFPISKLLLQLKFQQKLSHAQFFAEFLGEAVKNNWYLKAPLPDLIMPVPLHYLRLRERGFNQALEIARPLSRQLQIPLDTNSLQRIKNTNAQSELTAVARKKNMQDAFAANINYHGQVIALVDDVVTTAETVNACCKLLRAQGAKTVHIWCCARR